MNNIEFANPEFFWLFLVFVPLIIWYIFSYRKLYPSIQVSSVYDFRGNDIKKTPLQQFFSKVVYHLFLSKHILFVIRLAVISLIIVALARPQSSESWENVTTKGIDIVLSLDISGSMLAEDLKPNRLEASKNVAKEFIAGRPLDRMGLVVFAGESFTQCPLTTDHAVLINLFKDIKSGILEDGTAIGLGLANAVSRLKESDAISKVIILLTDGVSNRGEIDPITASEIASTFGIRVYTIGVGTKGLAPYPVQTAFGIQYQNMEVEIDEKVLRQIAENTGGKYFRATSNKKLTEIYQEIDKLEKSKIEVKEYSNKNEEFLPYLIAAMLLFLVEILLRYTVLRSIP